MKAHLHAFFNKHKGARRLGLFISYSLMIYATIMVLQPEVFTKVNGSSAAIFATLVGVIGAPIMFYFHSRNKDAKNPDEQP